MLEKLHIAHLTGTAEIIKNYDFTDMVRFNANSRYSIKQMFFEPYKSTEFLFCLRNTVQPAIILATLPLLLNPGVLAAVINGLAIAAVLMSAGVEGWDGLVDIFQETSILDVAEDMLTRALQGIINLIIFPITLVALITRSISSVVSLIGEDESQMSGALHM